MPIRVLTLLGTLQLTRDGVPITRFHSDKVRALLAYLATEADRPHTRAALAGLLWPEQAEAGALRNLSQTLVRLRDVLGQTDADPAPLQVTWQGVQWRSAAAVVDVVEFRRLARSADPQDLARAAALYRGEFLAGFGLPDCEAFEEWLLLTREQFQQQALAVLHTLAEQHLAARRWPEAAAAARRQVELDRWHEAAHRQLMRALAGAGDRAAALAAYERCAQMLRADLDVAPDVETLALYEQIRAGARGERVPAGDDAAAALASARRASTPLRHIVGEVPETPHVYGRQRELAHLQRWLVEDRCRLIAVLGIGGVGKTTLAAAAVKIVAAQFDAVIWRALLNAPPLDELLGDLLQALAGQSLIELPAGLDAQLTLLMDALRRQRCLLVLDNLESILQPDRPGQMRPGYEGYAQLIQAVAEREQQSCLLLTSRERPQGMARREGDSTLVHTLPLGGLDAATGQAMLTERGLASTEEDAAALVTRYSGNPLALKLVAQTVQDLFGGDIAAFLAVDAPIFDDIRTVLDQQFARLSPLEQELLIWLAIEREPVSVQALRDDLVDPGPSRAFVEALRALQRRSLLEQSVHGYGLQNVVAEYLTEVLVDQVCRAIAGDPESGSPGDMGGESSISASHPRSVVASALNRYALLKGTAKAYVRASQMRLIVQPIASCLSTRLGRAALVAQLTRILAALRATAPGAPGYAAGNLLNLLLQLGVDVRGYDFARLAVWQAYLRGALLPEVNFSGADLARSVFTHIFGEILAIRFDAADHVLVASVVEGKLCVWRAADGQLLRAYQAFGASASIAAFSHDGRLLLTGDTAHQVRVWDVEHGRLVHRLSEHAETPWGLLFSPDGTLLATSGADGVVQVWDAQTGCRRHILQGHTLAVPALAFTADGQTLASGDIGGTVCVWRLGVAEAVHVFHDHAEEVHALVFDTTGTLLASGSHDRTIRLWDVRCGRLVHTLRAHTEVIRALAMSPDGQTLASGGGDTFVCLWDVRSGRARHTLLDLPHRTDFLTFSRDGHTLATVGADHTIHLWDAVTGRRLDSLQAYRNRIYAVAFSPDGQWLAGAGTAGIVRLWDVRAPDRIVRVLHGHTSGISALALSPDGAILASAGGDRTIRLWDVPIGHTIGVLSGHTEDVEAIQFSPDGQWLVSASRDTTLRLWEVRSGQTLQVLHGHTERVLTCAVSPDGELVASGSIDRTVCLWKVQPGGEAAVAHRLSGHTNAIRCVVFSPDGRLLISSGFDQTVRVWDTRSGRELSMLPAQDTITTSIVFHPSGVLLATGAKDGMVRLWDVATSEVAGGCAPRQPLFHVTHRRTLCGHTGSVESVCFSPDGRWLASASADETIRLWDVATGAFVQMLRGEGPYAGMNITGVTGISAAQKAALKALGAVETAREQSVPKTQ